MDSNARAQAPPSAVAPQLWRDRPETDAGCKDDVQISWPGQNCLSRHSFRATAERRGGSPLAIHRSCLQRFVSHPRPNALVSRTPRSALDTPGLRRGDWARSPVVVDNGWATAGAPSLEARYRPRLVLPGKHILRLNCFWSIRPTRTSAKNWSHEFLRNIGQPSAKVPG